MRDDEARALRDRNLEAVALGLGVGPREQHEVGRLAAVPVRFHRRHLGGLVLRGVEAVEVADHELQRREHGQHADAHPRHGAAFLEEAPRDEVARADCEHHERGREVGRREHVHEAVREARVEDDLEPAHRVGDAVAHLEAGRGLHPAVRGEDPERRQRGAESDDDGRHRMQPLRHAVAAEQHDAEEGGLEEERGQHLVADHRADDVAGDLREAAPVGAELVRQHDARHHAHREGDGEDLGPEPRQRAVVLAAGAQVGDQQGGDERRQADREGREDDVEADGEGKLDAGEQHQRVRCEVHGSSIR